MNNVFKKLLVTSAILCSTLLSTSSYADFEINRGDVLEVNKAENACIKMKDDSALNREKAAAILIWTIYCRPEVMRKVLANEGLFSFNGEQAFLEGKEVALNEVIKSYLLLWGENLMMRDDGVESDMPMQVTQVPLLTYTASTPDKLNVLTRFPVELPIANLVNDREVMGPFCGSIPNSLTLDTGDTSGFATCSFEAKGDELVSLPTVKKMTYQVLGCQQIRLNYLKQKKISYKDFAKMEDENLIYDDTIPEQSLVKSKKTCTAWDVMRYLDEKKSFLSKFSSESIRKEMNQMLAPPRVKPPVIDPLWDPKPGEELSSGGRRGAIRDSLINPKDRFSKEKFGGDIRSMIEGASIKETLINNKIRIGR